MNSDRMIRVLHPITRMIVGGAQENTMYTASHLDKNQFQVEIISGPQTGSEGSLIDEARKLGVPITIIPQLLRQISPYDDLTTLLKLISIMKDNQYDIVHTHSSKAGILGRIAARIASIPIIIHTVHGWSFHDYLPKHTRTLYIHLEQWAASITDALIVVNTGDIQKGLNQNIGGSEQYHLIRSAIPLDQFQPRDWDRAQTRSELGIPRDAVVVGNVGRFSPQKNPLDWIRVAADIAKEHPEAYFLLVGDGPLHAEVDAELTKENIKHKTILTGLRRDVARMMSAMDIFLITSLWEGLPRVIPQAMAMGLPVVANRVDGTEDAIEHGINGYLCSPGDLPGASKYCKELLKNPSRRQELGENGREITQRDFDMRTMIKQIESLYMKMLRKKGYTIKE